MLAPWHREGPGLSLPATGEPWTVGDYLRYQSGGSSGRPARAAIAQNASRSWRRPSRSTNQSMRRSFPNPIRNRASTAATLSHPRAPITVSRRILPASGSTAPMTPGRRHRSRLLQDCERRPSRRHRLLATLRGGCSGYTRGEDQAGELIGITEAGVHIIVIVHGPHLAEVVRDLLRAHPMASPGDRALYSRDRTALVSRNLRPERLVAWCLVDT